MTSNHDKRHARSVLGKAAAGAMAASALGWIATAGVAAAGAATSSRAKPAAEPKINIAFFGFAKANSFAEATYNGIKQTAAKDDATVTFFDPDFSPTTQVSQIEDATVSGKYKVYIIQANDGSSVIPAVKQAIAKGITVVAEFTPIGTKYSTAAPQVPGVISLVDVPTINGHDLGELGLEACATVKAKPCQVAYLVGDPSLPLDDARTAAVVAELKTDSNVDLVSDSIVGGYTQSSGQTAAQNLFAAHKSVNVVIGSSQAIEGVYPVAKKLGIASKIKLIGNGGSFQAAAAVRSGQWFATYYEPEVTSGAKAARYGLEAARGEKVPHETNDTSYSPGGGLGTKSILLKANARGTYSDY
jgi:ribose transport system substrate-binding protein